MDNDENKIPSVEEPTLFQAINELDKVSWDINAYVFGEKSGSEKAELKSSKDNIDEARNKIMDSVRRLREASRVLKRIKK